MNQTSTKYFFIIFAFIGLTFNSCKSIKVLPNKAPIKNIKTKELTKVLYSSSPKLSLLRSRLKVSFDDGKRSQQLIVNLRMEKDEAVWLSATMLIPIAKILITPNKISFYEKFQKNSYEGDFSFIKKYLVNLKPFQYLRNRFS